MPTYQTTPYISWTFPDQAIEMNRKGVQPLKPVDLPQQDMIVGASSHWDAATRQSVLDGLETNRLKEQGMLGRRNTTERTQAFDRPAHLSQTRINGKFMAPSYEFTQTPSGLRGGTGLLTKEGRAWAKKQLKNRVRELNAIETGDFEEGRPRPVDLYPKLDFLDAALVQFLDAWEAGAVPGALVELANKCVIELYRVGAVISAGKLAEYVQVVASLQVQGERALSAGSTGPYAVSTEKKAVIRAVLGAFERFQRLAEEIARVVNESEDTRAMVMPEIGSRILGASLKEFRGFYGETQRNRAPYTPRLEPGAQPAAPFVAPAAPPARAADVRAFFGQRG